MESIEPSLEYAIKNLQKVVDFRCIGKKWVRLPAGLWLSTTIDTRTFWLQIGSR
jgi:hypothetical protein